jgi:hypothetical protein
MFDDDLEANNPKPVELLRDRKGVYGIGVSDAFDLRAIAWSCGVENEHFAYDPYVRVILRSDMLQDSSRYFRGYPVFQKIAGGFRRGPFMHSSEEALRKIIHHSALERAGLSWPPDISWWSTNKNEQARNRRIYHGLRRGSLK